MEHREDERSEEWMDHPLGNDRMSLFDRGT